jgi:pseudouridine synthase
MEKQKGTEMMRLHVRISHSGLCSRRAAEGMIREGRVCVNGVTVSELGTKVGPEDEVTVDNKVIKTARHITLLLNKPAGYITTLSDPHGRPTIERFLPDYGFQLRPVGRLDKDTDGLLLVTNDGELAMRATHPRYELEKEYEVVVAGNPTDKALQSLQKGVFLEGRLTSPAQVAIVHEGEQSTVLRMIIHEGRKRQIRLMCETVGYPVVKLTRIRIGPFKLKGMGPGECRLLGQAELSKLKKMLKME